MYFVAVDTRRFVKISRHFIVIVVVVIYIYNFVVIVILFLFFLSRIVYSFN